VEFMKLPRLIIFDWAGTLVDFGCCAPLAAFREAFETAGLRISDEVARRPMGAHKRDHIREILHYPEISLRIRSVLKQEPDELLVQTIFDEFSRRLPAQLLAHAAPVPQAVETLRWLQEKGVRIGSTTGYTRAMMNALEPAARASGIEPEVVVCADEVPQGRPAPWACFRIAERLNIYPLAHAIKIGDTPADMAEGRNAGMINIGVIESGNEMGLSLEALRSLAPEPRLQRVEAAKGRLKEAGADSVLGSIADLRSLFECGSP
jgi:phosphonoacetaldehyde hydrolase